MPLSDQPTWIDYAEFGERFVEAAVTESRIEAAVSGMAGRGMTIGPFSVGPAGLARFVAKGSVGKPHIVRHGPHVHFEVMVPVKLRVDITLGGQRLRLEAVVEIDLDLHARTARPLLIVIDIPPVTGRDVSFVMRAQAIGTAFELLLDPISRMVQREVANRLNAMLDDPESRRGRVFDVEAIIDGRQSEYRGQAEFDWIGYDEFGRQFFQRVVTAQRVREVVESLAGKPIEVGPLRTGPRNAAEVSVRGSVRMPRLATRGDAATRAVPASDANVDSGGGAGVSAGGAGGDTGGIGRGTGGAAPDLGGAAPDAGGAAPDVGEVAPDAGGAAPDAGGVAPDADEVGMDAASAELEPRIEHNGLHEEEPTDTDGLVAFDLTIPVTLDITVDVLKANRYRAEVEVPLELVARAADPLLIVIDTEAPAARDIALEVVAEGWRARMLGRLAKIDEQVAAQVAAVVRGEVADASRRTIDVAARLNSIGV
ncbi:hypothetical protein [Nocardia otitidiscaviarum]|uniref:hypothetical protein n=1 Tax=Nocardia otitidiscaviarum TaxID=1823 RepID=UPI0018955C0F|nr:hypothetical protein [Nocardia otitidiscaviarum]MBF6178183.1 hypothetical protein [Nocardia otitidiscaviarum]